MILKKSLPLGKFRLGDTVIVTTRRHGLQQKGAIGVIESFYSAHPPHWFRVRFTGGKPQYGKSNSYLEDDVELVKPLYEELEWV